MEFTLYKSCQIVYTNFSCFSKFQFPECHVDVQSASYPKNCE